MGQPRKYRWTLLCVYPGIYVVGIAAAILEEHVVTRLAVGTIPKDQLRRVSRTFGTDLAILPPHPVPGEANAIMEANGFRFASPVWNSESRTLPPWWRKRVGVEAKNAYRLMWSEIERANYALATRPVKYSNNWLMENERNAR